VIAVDSGGRTSEPASVEICIIDLNDNPPFFRPSRLKFAIPENTVQLITTLAATDADEISIGLTYSLVTEVESFRLFQNGTLYLEEPLNYEQQSMYHLYAIANDSEHVSSELEIAISVLNVNDHPPVFIQVSYTVELLENEAVGTVLATIQATDDDAQSLDGGIVTPPPLFALVTRYQVLEDGVPFEVRLNPETNAGVLVNTRSLDFESDRCSYSITVVAFDGGNKSSLIPARVRIELKNLNDNPFYFSNDTYHFTLQENFAGEIGFTEASHVHF